MDGVDFVDHSRHEAVVVTGHAKEALKAGLPSGNGGVIHSLDPQLEEHDGVTWCLR